MSASYAGASYARGLLALGLALALSPSARGVETERMLCDPNAGERCMPDVLKVVIVGTPHPNESVLELEDFVPGTRIDTRVVLLSETAGAQGWAYGVRHDPDVLALLETTVTTDGTRVETLLEQGFEVTGAAPGGYISAVVLSFGEKVSLPVGRNPVCNAGYTLVADPGAQGTRIRFADGEIGAPGSPPVEINITVNGESRRPELVSDGLVRTGGNGPAFLRGDANGDGRISLPDPVVTLGVLASGVPRPYDCAAAMDASGDGKVNLTDAILLLNWLFRQSAAPAAPFPECGPATESADCREGSPACGEG